MSTQTNKMIARLWIDFINKNDLEGLCALTADTWVMHGGLADLPRGCAGLRRIFASIGVIEQEWRIDDLIAEDDKVVCRATNRCIQESFFDVPSNGREQIFTATFTHYIANGRIQETWRNADDLGRVLQLGAQVIAAPPEAIRKAG